jgi:hypothetical protein
MDALLCQIDAKLHRTINLAQTRARSGAQKREQKTRVETTPYCTQNCTARSMCRNHAHDRALENAAKKREWRRPLNRLSPLKPTMGTSVMHTCWRDIMQGVAFIKCIEAKNTLPGKLISASRIKLFVSPAFLKFLKLVHFW